MNIQEMKDKRASLAIEKTQLQSEVTVLGKLNPQRKVLLEKIYKLEAEIVKLNGKIKGHNNNKWQEYSGRAHTNIRALLREMIPFSFPDDKTAGLAKKLAAECFSPHEKEYHHYVHGEIEI